MGAVGTNVCSVNSVGIVRSVSNCVQCGHCVQCSLWCGFLTVSGGVSTVSRECDMMVVFALNVWRSRGMAGVIVIGGWLYECCSEASYSEVAC